MNNLSVYGIDCKNFCHEIQTGAAASASVISSAPQCEGPQVLVQGNQVSFFIRLEKCLGKNWHDLKCLQLTFEAILGRGNLRPYHSPGKATDRSRFRRYALDGLTPSSLDKHASTVVLSERWMNRRKTAIPSYETEP